MVPAATPGTHCQQWLSPVAQPPFAGVGRVLGASSDGVAVEGSALSLNKSPEVQLPI